MILRSSKARTERSLYEHFKSIYAPEKYSGKETLVNLKLSEISLIPSLFQPRQYLENLAEHERHIELLTKTLKHDHPLDPILVMPITEGYACIDGHHRIRAYKKAKKKTIPAEVFTGAFKDGWAQSIEGNIKDKLPMTTQDKMEAAWRMVLTEDFTWNEIVNATKASRATVSRMAKTFKRLNSDRKHPHEYTWKFARDLGNKREDWDKTGLDKLRQSWAKRIGRHFGAKIADAPQLFAEALMMYSENAAQDIYRELHWAYKDTIEDEEEWLEYDEQDEH